MDQDRAIYSGGKYKQSNKKKMPIRILKAATSRPLAAKEHWIVQIKYKYHASGR